MEGGGIGVVGKRKREGGGGGGVLDEWEWKRLGEGGRELGLVERLR